jgi:hypothetical protein
VSVLVKLFVTKKERLSAVESQDPGRARIWLVKLALLVMFGNSLLVEVWQCECAVDNVGRCTIREGGGATMVFWR